MNVTVSTKIGKLKVDYPKLNKVMKTDEDFDRYMNKVVEAGKKALKENIERVSTSHDPEQTPAQIRHGAEYYEKLVSGSVVAGRKKKLGSVWMNGNQSLDYEAEHGVLEKTLQDIKREMS